MSPQPHNTETATEVANNKKSSSTALPKKNNFLQLLLTYSIPIALVLFAIGYLIIFFYIDHQQNVLLQALLQHDDTVYSNKSSYVDSNLVQKTHDLLQNVLMIFLILLGAFIFCAILILRHMRQNTGKLHILGDQTQKINRRLQEEMAKGEGLSQQLDNLNSRLKYQSFHDSLTGLPNQFLLEDRLESAIAVSKRNKQAFVVAIIDFDMQQINKTLDADMTDTLLKAIADRLLLQVRGSDTVARLQDKQFVLLLTQLDSPDTAVFSTERIHRLLDKPFSVGNQELVIKTSMGVSIYPYDSDDPKMLLKNASIALQQAIENKTEHTQFYRENINLTNQRRFLLKDSLQQAFDQSEFSIDYLPLVNVEEKKVMGIKAVIHWDHAQLGDVSSLELLALADNIGLSIAICKWMLRAACQQFQQWNTQNYNLEKLFITISRSQLANPQFVQHVNQILEETGISPAHLVLTLPEELLLKDRDIVTQQLDNLKNIGINIAISNFRGGYLSLNNLERLPIDYLKLDSALIQNFTLDNGNLAIIKACITLANSLQWTVVATEVKTLEQKNYLLQQGCKIMRGSFFDEEYGNKFLINKQD